ncbi:MAG: AbfB domain-containing protein [Cytophagaceae bacterium]|nr:AbfB domain-containing protein [Cytophagaceae bacterium]
MKKFYILLAALPFFVSSLATAQNVAYNPWQMNRGEGAIDLKSKNIDLKSMHGNPVAYPLAIIPVKDDPKWEKAPMNAKNEIEFSESSVLPCYEQVDFTYFRTFMAIPDGPKIQKLTVTIGYVDDGARMMIFNSKHPKGYYNPANDGKLAGANFTTDFSKEFVAGETNTIVIVQMDDCRVLNNLKGGLTVKVNDQAVPPAAEGTVKLPGKQYFDINNLRAYSINGGGYSNSEPFGVILKNGTSVIRTLNGMSATDSYLNIKREKVGDANGNPVVAFKVTNSTTPNNYLTLTGTSPGDNKITVKQYTAGIPAEAKFYEENPLYTDPNNTGFKSYQSTKFSGSYLRHQGLSLEIDPKLETDLYKKDASWRIEKLN